jgi:sec-independent protein translocase protein TatA
MFGLGIGELFLILMIVLLVFGAGKLGDLGGDLGRAIRNFRKAMSEPDAIDVTPKEEARKEVESEGSKKA